MSLPYHPAYPSIDDLRHKAKRSIPRFAFEYLDGGCNEDVNLQKNTAELRQVELKPYYLRRYTSPDLGIELFGHRYAAPFGIAPVGLQGLMWPKAPEILATAAAKQNIPFILSGAVVTEQIFSWDGMGLLFTRSLSTLDSPVLILFVMMTAIAVVVFQLLTDIAYAWLDPRVRYD